MNALLQLRVPFILASQSPRRRELLEQLQVSFSVQVSPADETVDQDDPPERMAEGLADTKARPVAEAHPNAVVLAADTIVVHENTVFEKPSTKDEAVGMLTRLSGTTHSVYTGVALHHRDSGREIVTGCETKVQFGTLSAAEIEAYVATGSPMDKAGGYGIQDHTGRLFVDQITGDYYNVVGLPLRTVYQTLISEYSDVLDGPAVADQ